MTRFARARGSKASNERAPEDGTPWEVMREQLLQAKKDSDDSKNRQEAEQKRIENYENFLKEQKVQKRKATWCEFPENEKTKTAISDNVEPPSKKKKNKKDKASADLDIMKPLSKKKKNKKDEASDVLNGQDHTKEKQDIVKKVKNESDTAVKKSKRNNKIQNDSQTTNATDQVNDSQKSHKKKQKKQNIQLNNTSSEPQTDSTQTVIIHNQNHNEKKQNNNQQKKKRNKKLIDGKPARRKEINDHSFQLIINGKEVELIRFDGFPVMKKDAERLQELKDSMIKKGIPKSEVQRTIKLERRRAEKALARVKRDVCYNCRKGGHVLSDCPELKSKIPGADGADGVCFKCGSTEHRQFECKVQKDKEFRFATCFICKEPGHIARQCPDNPKGLYPNGGNCKLCGDVTHLRKDCPTIMDKKEGSTVKLQTLDSGENIEDVGLQTSKITPVETSKKPKKIRF